MASRNQPPINYGELDKIALWTLISLALTGWLMIYAANYKPTEPWAFLDLQHNAGKQLLFIVACSGLFFIIQLIEWTFWRTFAWAFYGASLVLLVAVLFFGKLVNGARAWFEIGGFGFQPAELAKFSTCLALASFLSGFSFNFRSMPQRFLAFGIFLLPVGLILLQPDAGSALVFFSFVLLLYREGFNQNFYLVGASLAAMVILGLVFDPAWLAAILLAVLNGYYILRLKSPRAWWAVWLAVGLLTWFWGEIWGLAGQHFQRDFWNEWHLEFAFLPLHALLLGILFNLNYSKKNSLQQRPVLIALLLFGIGAGIAFGANYLCFNVLSKHQQELIKVWLRPQECDPRGSMYNLVQSKMAIGSGGFSGKGFLEGNMTKLRYVPEQSTDFIFCTVGEEQGFIGVLAVVGLFTVLLWRITVIAERQRADFARRYAYGVVGILFVHFLINIGMTMGLFPIIGIPLPFVSYGGSSLIGFTLLMAVLLKFDASGRERN